RQDHDRRRTRRGCVLPRLLVGRAARRGRGHAPPAETLRHARSARRRVNPRLDQLTAYPFERLARLKAGITPPPALPHIAMSIGEPKHAPPAFVVDAMRGALGKLDSYPATAGLPETREACAAWLKRRFGLGRVDAATMVLPVNGTREALFSFVQAVVSTAGEARPAVAMPNPFYQIYEGAALL